MTNKLLMMSSLLVVVVLGFTGCIDPAEEATTGTLNVILTDAPFPTELVAEANVTIVKLEARANSDSSGSPYVLLSEEVNTYNLLDLQNGVTASLASLEIPVGSYDLIRLYVSEGEVVMNEGTRYTLTVPSGAQTGIKLFIDPPIDVTGGLTSDLLLDFDVASSFIAQGNQNITGFLFKPTIRAVNASTVGSLAGGVTDTSAVAIVGAQVWVVQDTVVTSAFSDSTGFYTILGLAAGNYTANATLSGYDTVSVSVDIGAGSQTSISFELTQQ